MYKRQKGGCQGGQVCLTHNLWADLSARIEDFLQKITLSELVEQRDVKSVSERQDKATQKKVDTSTLKNLIKSDILLTSSNS